MKRHEQLYSPDRFDDMAAVEATFGARYNKVVEAIDGLPPKQAEAVSLSFWGRWSERRIARELECSKTYVHLLLAQAMDAIREALTLKIVCDMDGVVWDFDSAVKRLFLSALVPEALTVAQREELRKPTTSWDHLRPIVGETNWQWLWERGADEYRVFIDGLPYPGAVTALKRLCDKHEVHIVTARPLACAWQTYLFLGERGLSPASVSHQRGKIQHARTLQFDVAIDDRYSVLRSYAKGNTRGQVYGVRRPWNEAERAEGRAYRRLKWVDGLAEMVELIDQEEAA